MGFCVFSQWQDPTCFYVIIEIYYKCSLPDVLLLPQISGSAERTGRVVLLSRGGSEGAGHPARHV